MMKKIILFLLFTNFIFAQEKSKKDFNFKPEFKAAFVTKYFFGDNYLSKGHKNPSIGGIIKLNIVEYFNFKLGGSLEKSTIKVSDYSIGGNINKTNINAAQGIISYQIPIKEKFSFEPQIAIGNLELKQKSGKKLYGTQSGVSYSLGFDFIYKINKTVQVFSNIEITKYKFNTYTSNEFLSYFNNSNSINLSLGVKL